MKKIQKPKSSVFCLYFHGLCFAKRNYSQKLPHKTEPEVHTTIALFVVSHSKFYLALSHISDALPGKILEEVGIDRTVPIAQSLTKKQACLTELIIQYLN